jgi:hypothetical protein
MSRLEQLLSGILLLIGLLLAVWLGVRGYGIHQYEAGHAAAVSERAAQDAVAIITRTKDNAVLSIKQDAINAALTKAKNEELDPVRGRIATAPGVRVGAAICPGGPAAASQAEGATGSDGADPPGRLVRADVDRDLRALTLAVEEDLATGRACQRFLQENGLVSP